MKIPLTDSRLTAIASGSLDAELDVVAIGGIGLPVPVTPVLDNAPPGFSLRRDGNKAWFTIGEFKKGKISEPIEVSVHIENEELVFFPQRSAAHRELLRVLGEGD